MAFRCPYCQFRIATKAPPKPGKYTPSCPKCKGKISLIVPADVAGEWIASAIPGQLPKLTTDVDVVIESTPPPPARKLSPPSDADATEVTGAFGSASLGDATEVTGDSGSRRETEDHTEVIAAEVANADRTGAFGGAAKTVTGDNDTVSNTVAGTPKKAKRKTPATEVDIPNTLGGYEVVKELGRGGMGAVYLARQVSLDRPVALKVMNNRWAGDPVFLARFTREAFAAAQLVHHNVVQIYDIGEQEGINFFSMEFVEGKSLGEVLKKDGKLDIESAIGFALQAARGLKFAHDRGMVHRDVKPDNLMINVHGIVKVADLGLVKTPTMTPEDDALPQNAITDPGSFKSMTGLKAIKSDITVAHTAMGSPAYMSPEQCRDAAAVDPRADIYSLGCSIYALLAGRPPFQGANAFDVMTKHATESPQPIPNVPKEVNALVLKTLAKKPDDRFQSMDELIAALERLLPGKGGAIGPSEDHLNALEESVRKFQSASMAKIRKPLILAFFLGMLLAAIVGLFVGSGLVTGAIVALAVETTLAYFVIDGFFGKSYLFKRVREWSFGARITDWAIAIVGGAALLLVLWLVGLLWVWLGTAVVAVGIAFVFHFVVDKQLAVQRRGAIDDCERLLKRLRLAGIDEDAIRLFVAKNAGRGWEEYYESLFGFEAKLAARPAVEEQAGGRLPHFAAWREPLIARLDRVQQARREAKSRKVLQKVEANMLEAEGVDKREARAQAEAAAEHMVEKAAEIKASKQKAINVRAMLVQAEKPPQKLSKPASYHIRKAFDLVAGWRVRFLVGLVLIALGALWVRGQVDTSALGEAASGVTGAETSDSAQAAAKEAAGSLKGLLARENPLKVAVIGPFVGWVDCLNPLLAGIFVFISCFNHRSLGILLQLVGAMVTLVGHQFGVPDVGPVAAHQLTMVVGVVLAGLGIVVSRK